ncbi:uncharacterized protein EAE97_010171 [Botrytis byssoidea]|uniref:Uncharacterized protein n=1 Tax=Botrytis byssoidea TaxID=139641 RepID=A0A9P5I402_9HELO|nr:uncharacterized protein EAE97_010171 [Botrytis byssoidea]KAF7926662.1 hypothetical protein EAE97_010171 [Botrytis byssoidea]
MCLSIKHIHTCGHATYHPQPCSSTANPPHCPYFEARELEISRNCNQCLLDQGAYHGIVAGRDRTHEAVRRKKSLVRERGKVEKGKIRKENGAGCCPVM